MAIPPINTPNMTDRTRVMNMLRDGLISHDTRIQNVRDDLNEQAKKVNLLEEIVLLGTPQSGQISHAERIRNLEAYASATKFWLRTVAIAIVLQTLTFGSAAIVYFVKLYPVLERLANTP